MIATIIAIPSFGLWRGRGGTTTSHYLLAGKTMPWYAMGLSIMATQASAITFIATTGQAYVDGMRFVQFYFGLPIAMVILGVTIVPFLYRAKVYTAYEFLERRFDAKTRSLTSVLFLFSRALSCGAIIAAPAVVFSTIFGWSMVTSVACIGLPTVIYTMICGVQAVTWADVKQMAVIVTTLVAVVIVLLVRLPVSPDGALRLAGATGRLRVFDFSLNLHDTYTFWTGIIGGTFLMLSYFGTDQSQVQRYLSAKSVDEARSAHLISAYWKIPLQALVLLVGVLVFVYYLFLAPPLYFNPAHERLVRNADPTAYELLDSRYHALFDARTAAARDLAAAPRGADAAERKTLRERDLAVTQVHGEARALAEKISGTPSRDVNYIIPHFVLTELPIGLTGLFIAAVIAAAMSAVAGELSALSTATVIDHYRRWMNPGADDRRLLVVSRAATGAWGLIACGVAVFSASLGSLIEVVNRYGSIFYGSILGVFILAMLPRIRANAAFLGLIAGMSAVGSVIVFAPQVSFLWHNVVGAVTVVAAGALLSAFMAPPQPVAD